MKLTKQFSAIFLFSMLTACGGGGSSAGNTDASTYKFLTPKAGTQLVFANTLVDNLNNTLNRTLVENITAVNADGSFTYTINDPSGDTNISGTVNQTFYPTTYNATSMAQDVSWVITPYTGSAISCAASPHTSGAPSPLAAGQGWTISYTQVCGTQAPLAFTQTGTYVGVESITVPAGTFSAYKFQSVITYVRNGITVTESVTNWRNAAATDSRTLKQVTAYTYSGGTPAQGSAVSATRLLQSYH